MHSYCHHQQAHHLTLRKGFLPFTHTQTTDPLARGLRRHFRTLTPSLNLFALIKKTQTPKRRKTILRVTRRPQADVFAILGNCLPAV